MNLDDIIKYCEEKAEDKRRIAELCKNTRSYEDGWSIWEKGSEKYFQIADWLKVLKNIQSTGCCNTCKSIGMCEYEPKTGQMVRYNCPFYKEEKIIKSKMTYGMIYNEFCKKFPNVDVSDYRPAMPNYVPELEEYIGIGIPYAIIVWLKDGSKIIYIAESEV